METKQLRAYSGQTVKHRIDPQTVFCMRNITEELSKVLGISPSQAVLIRRALRHYSEFIFELTSQARIKPLQDEKHQLILAAGRPGAMN
jgi:hypothetical protein